MVSVLLASVPSLPPGIHHSHILLVSFLVLVPGRKYSLESLHGELLDDRAGYRGNVLLIWRSTILLGHREAGTRRDGGERPQCLA